MLVNMYTMSFIHDYCPVNIEYWYPVTTDSVGIVYTTSHNRSRLSFMVSCVRFSSKHAWTPPLESLLAAVYGF